MSSEPNKKMDDLLKRYVEERKAESRADFELHPATRKMLQGEVARVFPKHESPAKRTLFFAMWPRLALAGAFTAMFLVTVLVLNKPQKIEPQLELSQNVKGPDFEMPAQERLGMQSSPRETRQEVAALSDKSEEKKDSFKWNAPASTPAPVLKEPANKSEIAGVGGGNFFERDLSGDLSALNESRTSALFSRYVTVTNSAHASIATDEVAGLQTPSAARGLSSSIATITGSARQSATMTAANRQRFVQQDLRAKYRQNLLSPAQPKILESFEVARVGNKIQLFDSDGSVYEGEIIDGAKEQSALGKAKQPADSDSEFAFKVSGMNQQLNHVVTFTGIFANTLSATNLPARTAGTFQAGESSRDSLLIGNGFIEGKVSIGDTNEFEIQAMESPR